MPDFTGGGNGQASAVAVSQAKQALSGNSQNDIGDAHSTNVPVDNASLTGNAGENAAGNAGANQASGDGNAQGNQATVATSSSSVGDVSDLADAKTIAAQSSTGVTAQNDGTIATASINGNAFQSASGNMGVNQATHSGNGQLNQLSIASAPAATHAVAASSLNQTASGAVITNTWNDVLTHGASSAATLTDNAFAGVSGNVGVNQASGLGNMQSNSLAVSAASNAAGNTAGAPGNGADGSGQLTSSALARSDQASSGNNETDNEAISSSASIGGNAGYGVSGNAGANQSSGDFNLQGNQATIAALSAASNAGDVTAEAKARAAQSSLSDMITSYGTVTTANINGNALQNASGNAGVNQAAGSGNKQLNQLAIATAPGSTHAGATSSLDQASSGYTVLNGIAGYPLGAFAQGNDAANLGGNVFAGATGNLGLNQSSGFGNMQDNSLALSVSSNAGASPDAAPNGAGDVQGASTAAARSHGNQAASGESETLYALASANATISGNVGDGVSGNVGLNQSSGDLNLQGNQATIAAASGTSGQGGSASRSATTATQSSVSNMGQNDGSPLAANIGSNAFRNASGNLGLNQASGGGNQQLNQLAIATAQNAAGAAANASLDQTLHANTLSSGPGSQCSIFGCVNFTPSEAATLTDEAIAGASGNIGVNQAAGLGNTESNGLAVAVSATSNNHAGSSQSQATQGASGMTTANTAGVNPNDLSTQSGDVGDGASGNVGVNQASGQGNALGNQVAISVSRSAADDAAFTFGSAAQATATATQSNSSSASTNDGPAEQATITDNAFRNASGNLGVNQVAGDDNKQLNQTSIVEVQNAADAFAVLSLDQEASNNTVSNNASATNTAQLSGNALVNVGGNISVNQAVGDQNMQTNGLALAISNR